MHRLRQLADHASNLVRSRVPWLDDPVNPESPLPYVAHRPTVNPVLPVYDMEAAIAFYRSLGFAVTAYDAGYAWVRTCGWEFFHLVAAAGMAPGSSNAGAYVHVTDVHAWHAAITGNAPAVAVGDVVDQPWGMREFSIVDPAGNTVRIGQNA